MTPTTCPSAMTVSAAARPPSPEHMASSDSPRSILAAVDVAEILGGQLEAVPQPGGETGNDGVREHRTDLDGLVGADLDRAEGSGLEAGSFHFGLRLGQPGRRGAPGPDCCRCACRTARPTRWRKPGPVPSRRSGPGVRSEERKSEFHGVLPLKRNRVDGSGRIDDGGAVAHLEHQNAVPGLRAGPSARRARSSMVRPWTGEGQDQSHLEPPLAFGGLQGGPRHR